MVFGEEMERCCDLVHQMKLDLSAFPAPVSLQPRLYQDSVETSDSGPTSATVTLTEEPQ